LQDKGAVDAAMVSAKQLMEALSEMKQQFSLQDVQSIARYAVAGSKLYPEEAL